MLDLKKIKQFIEKNLYLTILVSYSVLVGIFLFWYSFLLDGNSLTIIRSADQEFGQGFVRQIDGIYVAEGEENLRPVVVMIENHYDSRPVAGLEKASIIYETIIEGGITRFLAVFDGGVSAKRIGPVRSARPFFIDMAEEWDGVYFHAGGSPEALAELKFSDLDRVNEISADGVFFWRDISKLPPHNLYTSSILMERAIASKNFGCSFREVF